MLLELLLQVPQAAASAHHQQHYDESVHNDLFNKLRPHKQESMNYVSVQLKYNSERERESERVSFGNSL